MTTQFQPGDRVVHTDSPKVVFVVLGLYANKGDFYTYKVELETTGERMYLCGLKRDLKRIE